MKIEPNLKFQLLLASITLVLNPTKLIAGTLSVNSLPPGVTVSISNNDRSVIINKNFFNLNPIDITFTITNDGGRNPDRYRFTDSVDNSTNKDWTDYHLELGFLDENGKFTRSGNNDLLDFGTGLPNPPAPPPTSDPFGEGQHRNNGNTLDYPKTPSPTLDQGDSGLFLFNVDVPDTLTNFTLRQQPTVKEPPRKEKEITKPHLNGVTEESINYDAASKTLSFDNYDINEAFLYDLTPSLDDPILQASVLIGNTSVIAESFDNRGWLFNDTTYQLIVDDTQVFTADVVDSFLFRGGGSMPNFDSEFQGTLENIVINNTIDSPYLSLLQSDLDKTRFLTMGCNILTETNDLENSGSSACSWIIIHLDGST